MGPPTADPPALKVAFIQDLAPEGALDRTLPAFQGAELAFTIASARDDAVATVQIVAFDTEGDADTARDVAEEIAADPTYVAAIAAPYLREPRLVAEAMGDTPFLSLSDRGAAMERAAALRFVVPLRDHAAELARLAGSLRTSRRGVCIAPVSGAPDSSARYVRRFLSLDVSITSAAGIDDIASAGCGIVVWTGYGAGAASLAVGLDADVRLIGGPGLRDADFLEDAGVSAEGALSICSCSDVSNSLDLAARRFIQTYQSENGTAPGPYALEGWDAARLVVHGLEEAGPSRAELIAWLTGVARFDGLANSYRWVEGELVAPRTFVRSYEVVGGRWVLAERDGQA